MDAAVLVAAGRGERLGRREPKALVPVAGRALFLHAMDALCEVVDGPVVLVVPPGEEARFRALAPRRALVVPGGATRQESVRCGVRALDPAVDTVLVHDAARPLVTRSLVEAVLLAARARGAAAAVLEVTDTLHRVDDASRLHPGVPREGLAAAQTPQGARRTLLLAALDAAAGGRPHGDEASALLAFGVEVVGVPGEPTNLKVTTPADLELAERLLRRRSANAASA
jgi:2-C-methyl-D-erythritol 4-phosphate cytidylyltransferase